MARELAQYGFCRPNGSVRGQATYHSCMSMRLRSDPELAAVVERARERAETMGELRAEPWSASDVLSSAEAREIVAAWASDGGYDCALAAVVIDDVDLANQ